MRIKRLERNPSSWLRARRAEPAVPNLNEAENHGIGKNDLEYPPFTALEVKKGEVRGLAVIWVTP